MGKESNESYCNCLSNDKLGDKFEVQQVSLHGFGKIMLVDWARLGIILASTATTEASKGPI